MGYSTTADYRPVVVIVKVFLLETMKVWRCGGTDTLILDLYTSTLDGNHWSVSHSRGVTILYLLNSKLLGSHEWSGAFAEKKIFSAAGNYTTNGQVCSLGMHGTVVNKIWRRDCLIL